MTTLRDFDALARAATADVVAFAHFVDQSEFLCARTDDAAARERYAEAWFDAEIINALALDRWDAEGRPAVWDATWRSAFQPDAAQAVAGMRAAAAYFSAEK
ncbi:hypothetical protein D3C71_1737490 [compost metagenome]